MNYFSDLTWEVMKKRFPPQKFDIAEYYKVLCPQEEYPHFLTRYIELPVLQRLSGISLLCGTDFTKLYDNRIKYSRLDHSIGVALIIWHFTKNKAQTISGLLHDISTPVFSHVCDFRKGDALTQTATEEPTSKIIRNDGALQELLKEDGLSSEDVENYHKYPVADNEIPQLSADRLEYMFPSGVALDGSWTFDEIKKCYNDVCILQNEFGEPELGFSHIKIAEMYCEKFCSIGHILQLNEDKLSLQMLGELLNMAVEFGILFEDDFMKFSEVQVLENIEKWIENQKKDCNKNQFAKKVGDFVFDAEYFEKLYFTFRNMTEVIHSDKKMSEKDYFNVNLKVKLRYINPLVKISEEDGAKSCRLSEVSDFARKIIQDFKEYSDTKFGCVKLLS